MQNALYFIYIHVYAMYVHVPTIDELGSLIICSTEQKWKNECTISSLSFQVLSVVTVSYHLLYFPMSADCSVWVGHSEGPQSQFGGAA